MGCAFPVIMLILFVPVLLLVFYFHIATFSFTKLGLSPEAALWLLILVLIGGMINIPVSRERFVVGDRPQTEIFPFLYYLPPQIQERVIAVNVGGALIPTLLSLYLLGRAPLLPAVIATCIVTFVAYKLARPVPGVGIALPAFIPPIVAAILALLLAPQNAAPVAYIAGVWGTLIGADILNLPRFRQLGANVLSIGGAGVFDGIFLVGIVAALLA
ncbi:MAG: DUF1614 domain-containing protein [Bacillota bacterium]